MHHRCIPYVSNSPMLGSLYISCHSFFPSIDIATELNYTKASVSVAMKGLREKELITMAETGYITLTEEGRLKAENVLERHTLLSDWLIRLGVSEEIAREDACRIEHDISEETFSVLKKHCFNQ